MAHLPLPEGWAEKTDKHSGKLFYFHRASKDKQWRHPLDPRGRRMSMMNAAPPVAEGEEEAKAETIKEEEEEEEQEQVEGGGEGKDEIAIATAFHREILNPFRSLFSLEKTIPRRRNRL
jgi:hypothetical protein